MEVSDLKNKLVAVLGYGVEGQAVTNYLLKHGVKPVLFDQRPWEEWTAKDQAQIKQLGINFIFGPDALEELNGFDVAFRSPGIKIFTPQLTRAQQKGLFVTSQTKWFFERAKAKIIGVTGTKGKGTTCTLIYQMLTKAGKRAFLTGNIGKLQPFEILESLLPQDWVVYELSSFQLQDLTISPHIGVVLMVTREHLDYHLSEREYVLAKEPITKYQSSQNFAVINADYEGSKAIGRLGEGKKIFFSRNKIIDQGCYVEEDRLVLHKVGNFLNQTVVKTSDLQLRGRHNLENACASVLAAVCAECPLDDIKQALVEFKGLEHRLEFVAEKREIKFYNDSFSTTPETAIAAIQAFSEPLILILGGSSKNADFSQLGQVISQAVNVKAIILIGQEANKIKQALKNSGGFKGRIFEGARSMPEIFSQIKQTAEPGDVVLLSPACASFDMFKNYIDRGEQFKQEVIKW